MQGLDLNPFLFREKLRSFDGFDQMSGLCSMFWFKSFRNFFWKITIFCTFDHWSEILSLSAGRPISQDACPALPSVSSTGDTHRKTDKERKLPNRFSTGINDTGGKFIYMLTQRCSKKNWTFSDWRFFCLICTLSCEYLRFSKKLKRS